MNSWEYGWRLQAGSGMCRQNFWCKVDSSCRARGKLLSERCKRGKKAEVSGRGLSFSPDILLIMYMLSEPPSQALLERGKKGAECSTEALNET